MTVTHAQSGVAPWRPDPVTPVPKYPAAGFVVRIGFIVLMVAMLASAFVTPVHTGRVVVLGPGSEQGLTSVEIVGGPSGRRDMELDGNRRKGEIVDVVLQGECRCEPVQYPSPWKAVSLLVVYVWAIGVVAVGIPRSWSRWRLAERMKESHRTLVPGAPTYPVGRSYWVQRRKHLVMAVDVLSPDGRSRIGQAHMAPIGPGFDPRVPFLAVADRDGRATLASTDGQQVVLLRDAVMTGHAILPVHDASPALNRMLGWEAAPGAIAADGIRVQDAAPIGPDPEVVGAAGKTMLRVAVLLGLILVAFVGSFVSALGGLLLVGTSVVVLVGWKWWVLRPLEKVVTGHGPGMDRRSVHLAADALRVLRAAKVLPAAPAPPGAGAWAAPV